MFEMIRGDTIRSLLKANCISNKDAAKALGIQQQSFNNKLYRNSFSVDDLVTIADICGYEVALKPKGKEIIL